MPENVSWKHLLDCALGIGIRLLKNGAEISRVEETVEKICYSYGAASMDVFAIPTKIEATLETKDDYFTTKVRRIYDSSLDLGRIEELNELSRYICKNTPSTDEIYKLIRDFDNKKDTNNQTILKCIAAFFGCGAFAIMYGGSLLDGLASGIVSLVMATLLFTLGKIVHYKIFNTLVLSIIGGFLSVAFYYMRIGEHISYIMIGAIMLLIPGKEFGIAFRELMMRDLVSGAIRLFQSIIIALMIVIGFSIPIATFNYQMDSYIFHEWYITIITGTIGCSMYSLIFGTKLKRLPSIVLGSAIVTGVYVLVDHYLDSLIVIIFISQVVGSIFAEVASRIEKAPAIVYLITTNLSLVPGGLLYYSVYAIWNNVVGAKTYLLDVLYSSLGIGAGILVVSILVSTIIRYIEHFNNKEDELIERK